MVVSKRNSKVRADVKRNRLYITLSDAIQKKEMENIYTDIRFCVADLRPGFSVITDLTRAKIGHLIGMSTFIKIMEYLNVNKVGRVVRVVGKAKVILQQMTRITDFVKDYKPFYVSTLEEAEAMLSELDNTSRSASAEMKERPEASSKSGPPGQATDADGKAGQQ